tara:strand:- start:45 stop:380 length:336 start_codon:yes stop_codon:yes gene_type:complete
MKKLKIQNEVIAKEEIMMQFVIADSNYKKYKKERNKLLPYVKDILNNSDNNTFTFKLLPHIKGFVQKVVVFAERFDSTTFKKDNPSVSEQYMVERESTTIVTDNAKYEVQS